MPPVNTRKVTQMIEGTTEMVAKSCLACRTQGNPCHLHVGIHRRVDRTQQIGIGWMALGKEREQTTEGIAETTTASSPLPRFPTNKWETPVAMLQGIVWTGLRIDWMAPDSAKQNTQVTDGTSESLRIPSEL